MVKKKAAFTTPEVLMALTIMTLVVGGVIIIYLTLQTVWQEESNRLTMHEEARSVMERMARGVYGVDGIREATSASLPSTSSIEYTSGVDGIERSFYLSGNKVMYDPNTSTSGDEVSIAENIRQDPAGLVFSINGKVAGISLSMEKVVNGKTLKVDLSTQVSLRN